MDFSSTRFDPAAPADFAVLMVTVSARQGASVSARRQAQLGQAPADAGAALLYPEDGSFSAAVARALRPQGEE